jgi:hypothetical protein
LIGRTGVAVVTKVGVSGLTACRHEATFSAVTELPVVTQRVYREMNVTLAGLIAQVGRAI